MTQAQKDALKWLSDHGGDGVFTYGGRLLAQGEIAPHTSRTWKALVDAGKCEQYRAGRARRIRVNL